MSTILIANRPSKRTGFGLRWLACGLLAGSVGFLGCGDPGDVPPRSDGGTAAGGSGTGGSAGSAAGGGQSGSGGSTTGGSGGSATGGSGGVATGGSGGSTTGGSAGSTGGSAGSTTGGSGGAGGGGAGGTSGTGGAAGAAGSAAGSGGTAGRVDAGTAGSGGAAGAIDGGRADTSSGDVRDGGVVDVSVDGAVNCGLANVVTKAYFDTIFPLANRHAVYTYEGMLAAAAAYPAFVNTGSLDTCRREAAAFLANVKRETGSLRYAEQIAKEAYCSTRTSCACDATTTDQSKWYYGRGAIQLSWNYNYCSAGTALGVDLLTTPSLVATSPELAWKTAIWFWMTSGGAGSGTCHAAMTTGGGFGETIRTINGGIECNAGGYGSNSAVTARVDAYIQYCRDLGIPDPGLPTDLDC